MVREIDWLCVTFVNNRINIPPVILVGLTHPRDCDWSHVCESLLFVVRDRVNFCEKVRVIELSARPCYFDVALLCSASYPVVT